MKFADMHCDTLYELLQKKKRGEACSLYENDGHIDLKKLKAGGALVQNFAMFVEKEKCGDPKEEALAMAGIFYEEMEKNKDSIAPATSFRQIAENKKAGKISALLTIEEGAVCLGRMENIKEFYDLGVRMMTLTWNYPNEIGFPNLPKKKRTEGEKGTDEKPWYKIPDTTNGLTPFGIEAVEYMEQLGMIIDVSHLSDAGFFDVLRHTGKPFVASHSNARAVSGWVRNLSDEMIQALANRGGVMGLNFCADFLQEGTPGEKNKGTMEAVIRHAKHIVNVGGMECLGLGSDFDGIDTNEGIPDYSCLPKLEDMLKKAGFTSTECEKIGSGNVLRVYREVIPI